MEAKTILLYPTYLPSIASMAAMAKADSIIFEVADNYQKQTYRNRAYIAHTNGKLLLTIPIKHSKELKHQSTRDVKPENEFPWLAEHWKSIQTAYRTSPFFEYYEDDLEPLFTREVDNLLDFNLRILEVLIELIGISGTILKTTEYHKNPDQFDARYLADCKKEKVYNFTTYHQVFEDKNGFFSNLSVLDLLCNEGSNSLNYLESLDVF
ncbi:hypothetical protein ULMS_15960 [Patiriisocius marinistellae]|uniref:WbqC-like protein n=1 Tax=Patiriisocius marinistellae TaxID=2494560 RepID=A0A5J4FXN1_9FLAO|nr:WbqC family protein [Patiriisocius marinistellae]GEQ86088.1 hypothetical protein ULMS_15960 [Patiriisocius marinistellae]